MKRYLFLLFLLPFIYSCNDRPAQSTSSVVVSPADSLRKELTDFISSKQADIGVAVIGLEDGDTLSVHGDQFYSLMSVAKFPQALLLLHLVDDGKISMAKPLHFTSADLQQRSGSSFRKDHPGESVDVMIPEALRYTIGQSDNITANKIFEMEGGPDAVNDFVHHAGVDDMIILTDYAHMGSDSLHRNRATPKAVVLLLEKFYRGKLLSDSSKNMLWKLMVESTSGPDRIKGLLPTGAVVAHKTGTGYTNDKSEFTEAFNDVGIVQLPNGKHFAIAVLVANSRETGNGNADIIAHICRRVWEYFLAKEHE